MTTEEQHGKMVRKLVKEPTNIYMQMTSKKAALLHAALGIAGEAGEIVDIIKKVAIYDQPLDEKKVAHLLEELGDMEFYLSDLRNILTFTREEVLQHNLDKLAIRYEGFNYSDKAALERADKEEGL